MASRARASFATRRPRSTTSSQRQRKGERVAPTHATFSEVADAWIAAQTSLRPNTPAGLPVGDRQAHQAEARSQAHRRRHDRRRERPDRRDGGRRLQAVDCTRRAHAAFADPRATRRAAARSARTRSNGSSGASDLASGAATSASSTARRSAAFSSTPRRTLYRAAASRRPIFSGLRIGELLGLTWGDVDFDGGTIRVRKQMDGRTGERVEPKTPHAVRDVMLIPALGRTLREHRLASPYSKAGDLVFCSAAGTGLDQRNVDRPRPDASVTNSRARAGRPRRRSRSTSSATASHRS